MTVMDLIEYTLNIKGIHEPVIIFREKRRNGSERQGKSVIYRRLTMSERV